MSKGSKGRFRPGEVVPQSGQARNPATNTEVTVVKGERFPPTPKTGQGYVMTDITKHKK